MFNWEDWCWSWQSNPLATWCEEPTHLKRPWCWERLKARGEGEGRSKLKAIYLLLLLILLKSQVMGSVQLSRSVVSDSLQPHGLQYARLPCPSPTPGAYSNSFHWVGDAIQPSHPLSSPSPPAFSLSQHQGLFQWVGSSHQVTKVLELQRQHQSFQWIFGTDLL